MRINPFIHRSFIIFSLFMIYTQFVLSPLQVLTKNKQIKNSFTFGAK
nr:MAG TPA: hypothetical protein [Caudoviricetes sp.]